MILQDKYKRLRHFFSSKHDSNIQYAFIASIVFFCLLYITAYRLVVLTEITQKEILATHTNQSIDSFALVAPIVLEQPDSLRILFSRIRIENTNIDSFVVYAEHGTNAWRVYLSDNGPHEGSVRENVPDIFNQATSDPQHTYTSFSGDEDDVRLTTVRAIVNEKGMISALAVVEQRMDKSDIQLIHTIEVFKNILLVGMLLFVAFLSVLYILYRKSHIQH